MAMHLMPLLPTLIQKGQLKKRSNICPFASQRDEERNVRSIVLHALPIRVKIDRPIVPSHRKYIRRYVLPNPNPLRQSIPRDLKPVRSPHGVGHRRRRRRRRWR